jgi:hypothetical protein
MTIFHLTWSILGASGANLTLGTCPFLRHARESGHPGATDTEPEALGPRLRGGDEEEKIGVICLVRTTSVEDRLGAERPVGRV